MRARSPKISVVVLSRRQQSISRHLDVRVNRIDPAKAIGRDQRPIVQLDGIAVASTAGIGQASRCLNTDRKRQQQNQQGTTKTTLLSLCLSALCPLPHVSVWIASCVTVYAHAWTDLVCQAGRQ